MALPKHIAIILDGNRRFARKRGLALQEGHARGAEKVGELIKWSKQAGLRELTLYIFSLENFNRNPKEKEHLMRLFLKYFLRLEKEAEKDKFNTRIRFIGRLNLFPKEVQDAARKIMKLTEKNSKHFINFAFGYGGRAEIVDAAKRLVCEAAEGSIKPEEITEASLLKHCYLSSEPDLIIRPGGEHRTSNFLTYQSAYSEWYFTDRYWPEFTRKDFFDAISDYSRRKRRFGK